MVREKSLPGYRNNTRIVLREFMVLFRLNFMIVLT